MAKVFLSYSHRDEAFVAPFYQRLNRDGVDCFFDKKSIARGENWVIALRDLGEEEARDLLRRAYSSSSKKFGADHPSTKKVEGNLRLVDKEISGGTEKE